MNKIIPQGILIVDVTIITTAMRSYLQIDEELVYQKLRKCVYKSAKTESEYFVNSTGVIDAIERIVKGLGGMVRYKKIQNNKFDNQDYRKINKIMTREEFYGNQKV